MTNQKKAKGPKSQQEGVEDAALFVSARDIERTAEKLNVEAGKALDVVIAKLTAAAGKRPELFPHGITAIHVSFEAALTATISVAATLEIEGPEQASGTEGLTAGT